MGQIMMLTYKPGKVIQIIMCAYCLMQSMEDYHDKKYIYREEENQHLTITSDLLQQPTRLQYT